MNSGLGNSTAVIERSNTTKGRDLGLAVFRIALGAYWLYEQHWKLPPDFGLRQPRGLMFAFQQSIQYPTLNLYKAFLQDIVVPNFHLFGWMVFLGEVVIGLSLLLGLGARLGALMGTAQAINLLVSQACTPEGPWIYMAILAASLFVLFTPSNRRLSLDRVLAPKLAEPASHGNLLARLLRWTM